MDKEITAAEWTIRTQKKCILGEDEQDALVSWLGDAKCACTGHEPDSRAKACGSVVVNGTPMQLPEILFGNNAMEFHHAPSGFLLQFEARGALKQWVNLFSAGKFEVIKVQEAREWQARPDTSVRQQEYDWTWGTDYAGSSWRVAVAGATRDPAKASTKTLHWTSCQPGGIDKLMLRDTKSPILMYDEVALYEDFIHDHGVVRLSVKTRVMPRCWFVLLRYWLRVDAVLMKVFDTRCFHKFGDDCVYRERTQHSATFKSLRERGISVDPSLYRDAEAALGVLDLSAGPLYDRVTLYQTDESNPG